MKILEQRIIKYAIVANLLVTGTVFIFFVISFFPWVSKTSDFLQDNSALIMLFLTFMYVLITYLMLSSSIKANEENLRPYVIVSLPVNNLKLYFTIQNIGKRPAHNVQIETNPPIETIQDKVLKGNCNTLLYQYFLAPNQELKNLVGHTPSIISATSTKMFDITITYRDSNEKKYVEKQRINLDQYIYANKIVVKDNNSYLEGIEKHLNEISQSMKRQK